MNYYYSLSEMSRIPCFVIQKFAASPNFTREDFERRKTLTMFLTLLLSELGRGRHVCLKSKWTLLEQTCDQLSPEMMARRVKTRQMNLVLHRTTYPKLELIALLDELSSD